MLLDVTTKAGQRDLAMEIKNKVESIFNPTLVQPTRPKSYSSDTAPKVEMK